MHWLFRAEQLGGHVHVSVWAGSETQAERRARPKLGELVMDHDEWADLRMMIQNGGRYAFGAWEIDDRTTETTN